MSAMTDVFGMYTPTLPDVTPPTWPSSGTSSGVQQIYSGDWDNPNGNLEPDDPDLPAEYCKDQAEPVQKWFWSVDNQNWFQTQGT